MAHLQSTQKKTSTMSLTISSSSSSSREIASAAAASSCSSSSSFIAQRHSSLVQPLCISPQRTQSPQYNQQYSGNGVAPTFVKCLHDVSTVNGQLVVMECRLRGTPPLQVMWYREDEQILDSDDFRILRKKASSASVPEELCTLVITEAFPEDSGLFKCMVGNSFGTVSCSAMLEVYNDLEEQLESEASHHQIQEEGASLRQEAISFGQEQEAVFHQESVSSSASMASSSRKAEEFSSSLLHDTINLPPPEWPDSPCMDNSSMHNIDDFPEPLPACQSPEEEPPGRSEEESAPSYEGQRSPETHAHTLTPSPPPPSPPPPEQIKAPPTPKLFTPSKHTFTSSSSQSGSASMNLSDLPTFTPSAFPPSAFNYERPRHFIQSQASFQAPSYDSVQREAAQQERHDAAAQNVECVQSRAAQNSQSLAYNAQSLVETSGQVKTASAYNAQSLVETSGQVKTASAYNAQSLVETSGQVKTASAQSQSLSQSHSVSQSATQSHSLSKTQHQLQALSLSQSQSQSLSHNQSHNLSQSQSQSQSQSLSHNQSQSQTKTQTQMQANGTTGGKSSPSSSSNLSSPISTPASYHHPTPPTSLPASSALSPSHPPSSSASLPSSAPIPTISPLPRSAPMRSTITLTPSMPSATGLGSATLPSNPALATDARWSAPAAYLCSVLPGSTPSSSSPASSQLSPSSPRAPPPSGSSSYPQPLPTNQQNRVAPAVVSLPAAYKATPNILPKPILKKAMAPRPSSARSDDDIQGSKDALIQDLEKKLRSKEARRRTSQKLSHEERMARRLLGPDNASYMFDQDSLLDSQLDQPEAPEGRHTGGLWGKHHSGSDDRGNEGGAIQEKCYAPRFMQIPPDLTVEEGRFCRIDFKVGGLPAPDVCWYLDGKAIRPDDYHKMLVCEKGMLSFIIEIVTVHHAGVYECVARNRAGESRFTMRLDVLAQEVLRPPTFTQKMLNSRALEGDMVRLECKVDASPPPQLFWKKDKDMLRIDPKRMSLYQDGSGRQCLLIERVTKADAGWYTLSAINEAGMSTCNARLDVGTRSTAPMKTAPPASKTLKLLSSLSHLPTLTVDSPAQHTTPAPLYESPAPHRTAAAPLYESPAPQRTAAAPLYESPAAHQNTTDPLYESPTHEQNAADPLYESPTPQQHATAPLYESEEL